MSDSNVVKLRARSNATSASSTMPGQVTVAGTARTPDTAPAGQMESFSVSIKDLVEAISDGFSLYDPQDRLVIWNEKFANILHYAKDIMSPGVEYETLVRKCAFEHFLRQQATEREKEAWVEEAFHFHRTQGTYERTTADGKCYLVSRRRSAEGYTAVVWTDITERKKAEESLKHSEELYRELFEGSLQGILIQTPARILKFNRTFADIFGLGREDRLRVPKDLERLIAPHERKRLQRLWQAHARGESAPRDYEFQGARLDGRPIWLQASTTPVMWNGKPALQTALSDITQRKEFEEQLLAHKLESIATMAHGIAMEFQKVQSAIMGAVGLAKMEAYAAGLEPVMERLSEAEKLGEAASELVQQLLMLHRGGNPVRERTAVEELLHAALPFAGRRQNVIPLRRDKVHIKVEIGQRLWPVYVDKSQMISVFRALIENGIESMPFGGTMEITAENHALDRKTKGIPLPAGRYVKVVVSDEGSRIPDEFLRRIFDPYFTPYRGKNGLALANAHAIVSQHGGAITAAPRPGKGTRMSLFLPAFLNKAAQGSKA